MRSLRYTLCDVFTDRPLTGNALAVFTGAPGLEDDLLLAIAREMNLSETVFVLPPMAGGQARLRIFTPKKEIPFAGHPLLGAAAVIGRTIAFDVLVLETGKGNISIALDREGAEVRSGRMLQPLPSVTPFEETGPLLDALGLSRSALPILLYENGPRHVVLAVEDVGSLRALSPDFGRLARVHDETVAVFTRDGERLEARVFAPGAGVLEDPATGSAAGPIALHAIRHGWAVSGDRIDIGQGGSIERPSQLYARIEGPAEAPVSVEVGGDVVIIGRGELRVP